MKTRRVSPTGSYSFTIPVECIEEVDGRVVSFWREGDDLLFQVSSAARIEGQQVDARTRLRGRLQSEVLTQVTTRIDSLDGCPDFASASARDAKGTHWLFAYCVWPELTVFATLSHPKEPVAESSWVVDALRSLRRD